MLQEVLDGTVVDLLWRCSRQTGHFGPAYILLETEARTFWSCGYAHSSPERITVVASQAQQVHEDITMHELMESLASEGLPLLCDKRLSGMLRDYFRLDAYEGVCYTKNGSLIVYNTQETYEIPE
jgi:hypothetical protein